MAERIYLSSPHMGGNELKYIQEAFDTNWISPVGPNIEKFEQAICDYTGVQYATALSSGTAAIHLALIMLGVEQGDEVICSSFTFAGSCNPIVYLKAKPIFIDSETETWNMDPELLEEAINNRLKKGKKPKAIIMVHLYGMPAKVDEIMAIAQKHNIPVIEDAAEALGAKYKGKAAGTFGDIGIFSFNGNKIITTSGGGALVSNRKEYAEKARFLATQARDQAPHYEHTQIGYNYRLSNISAGIGRGQLEILDDHVLKRRQIFERYYEMLAPIEGINFLEERKECFSNRWLTTILIDEENLGVDREYIRQRLEEDNIESRPLWKPMHLQPVYKDTIYFGNKTSDSLFKNGLCLPSGSNMTDDQMKRVINGLTKVVAKKVNK